MINNYRVIFTNLGGTITETVSGSEYPKGIWDMRIRLEVLDKIKELKPDYIFIISNQGGISKGLINLRNFEFKMEYIIRSIKEYTGVKIVEYSYCSSPDPNNYYRKPNPGMLESLSKKFIKDEVIDKSDCILIGDSVVDYRTARNFQIRYVNVNNFLRDGKKYNDI